MKIAILDLTRHPLPLLSGIRRAGECIEDWLSQGFSDTKFEIFDIAGGIDQVPSMRNFDALVVSGSERSVYDDISWYVDVSDTLNESPVESLANRKETSIKTIKFLQKRNVLSKL